MLSVVIPAHNEASVIGRLLSGLLADVEPDEFEVVVVANGCTDDTAEVAATFGQRVRVVSTPIALKSAALKIGDAHVRGFPRLYIDADVELRTSDVRALADALNSPGVLAAAPERLHTMDGRSIAVRWYFDVWRKLPVVQDGLFGRGVVAVSRVGHQRLGAMTESMSDDLAASVAFAPHERRLVSGAVVVIHPPRNLRDLVRRRVRAVTGTVQLQTRMPSRVAPARTSWAHLLRIASAEPRMAPRVAVFLAVTALARMGARRRIRSGDFTTWLRDESSRAVPAQRRPSAEAPTKEDR